LAWHSSRWFTSYDSRLRPCGIEYFTHAVDGAIGSDGRNEDVDLTLLISPDFLRGGMPMNSWISRVLKMIEHHRVRCLTGELFRARDSICHQDARGEFNFASKL